MGAEGASSRCSVAFKLSDNLGDDVQSLALSGLLRGGIRPYGRDSLSELPQDIESGVLSGYLGRNRPFDGEWLAGKMLPLSFYLSSEGHFRGHWLDYFRAARMVATRDVATRDRLRELGVDAEFGGCFSLFSARALPFPPSGGVPYVVCTEEESFRAMCAEGDDLAIFFTPGPLWDYEHWTNLRARISACLFWLWLIHGARALYTNRLHAALPAVSYGTGVYCDPSIPGQPERFSGYEEMLGSRDAQKGLIGVDRIDELTDVLQRYGRDVPLLEFGFRGEMGIREMYADILKRGQLARTEAEVDAGFKRGAVLFRHKLKVCGRGGGSGDLPEVVSYANEVADSYIPSAREIADSYVSELLPREFRRYSPAARLRGYRWRLGVKIKGMLRRLGLR